MYGNHYSLARAKQSLWRFIFGKAGSAVSGVALLIVLIRSVDRADYGLYVAVIALLEIFYLVTGIGLSSFAQRYIPEFRMRASRRRLTRVIGAALAIRVVFAGGSVLLLGLVVESVLRYFDAEGAIVSLYVIGWLLVMGCIGRYLDEIFGALLMQGIIQGLLMMRSLLKLALLGVLLIGTSPIAANHLFQMELAVMTLSVVIGIWILARYLRMHESDSAGDTYTSPKMVSVSLRFYLVQVMGQIYGLDILKLMIAKTLGVGQTAAFGVSQSLVEMIRNYLPAHLLASWIRPLVVSRYVARADYGDLALFVSLALKLNLFGIVPLVVFFSATGNEFGTTVSGGKYPDIGHLLAWLAVLLAFQTVHLVLNIVTMAMERAGANIYATFLSCVGLPAALFFLPRVGAVGAVWGLILAEGIWCIYVWSSLSRGHIPISVGPRGILCILAAGAGSYVATVVVTAEVAPLYACARNALLIALVYLGVTAWMKPFTDKERDLLSRFVPRRVLLW